MKKKLIIGMILTSMLLFTGCGNKQIFDTQWTFTKAKIYFGGEIIEIEIDKWVDYDDTTIQLIDKNGKVYLTDIKNVILMNE